MTRGSFFDEDVPFGIIFPSIGLGRPGPTATTTPALSCDIERRRERERERERERKKKVNHSHTVPYGTSRKRERERERERDDNKRRCIDAKHSSLSSFETVFIFPSLAREDINSTDDDWKIGIGREEEEEEEEEEESRTLLPTVSGSKIPPLVFVAATTRSTNTLSIKGTSFFAKAWLMMTVASLLSQWVSAAACAFLYSSYECGDFFSGFKVTFFSKSPSNTCLDFFPLSLSLSVSVEHDHHRCRVFKSVFPVDRTLESSTKGPKTLCW